MSGPQVGPIKKQLKRQNGLVKTSVMMPMGQLCKTYKLRSVLRDEFLTDVNLIAEGKKGNILNQRAMPSKAAIHMQTQQQGE